MAKSESSMREPHGLDTHLKRNSVFTGSRQSMSGIRSVGKGDIGGFGKREESLVEGFVENSKFLLDEDGQTPNKKMKGKRFCCNL